jgi:hypothetical protein
MICSSKWLNPKLLNVTTEQVPATQPADTLPFNTRCGKDVWKHFLLSLCVVLLG